MAMPRQRNDRRRRPRSKFSHETSLSRRPAGSRAERKVILIVCGGKTEHKYLNGLRIRNRNVSVVFKVVPREPLPIVDYAMGCHSGDFDQVWCVIDVDGRDLLPAMAKARRNGIELAISNPCFEVWLLLHHKEHQAPFQDAKDAQRCLRTVCPHWTKAKTRFADFASGLDDAYERARKLDPSGADHRRNPSSSMWRLVAEMFPGEYTT